jgi:hypothetical protein
MVGSTKYTTDGHLLFFNRGFAQMIVAGKNEIGSGAADPFTEAMLYYHKFLEDSKFKIVKLQPMHPYHCLRLVHFTRFIAKTLHTEKVQSDVLAPIRPLFCHSTDLPMQVMAARTFGALRPAIEKLYSHPISSLEPEDPSLGCPYPRSYTNSTGHIQKFSYHETQIHRDKLFFFGEPVGNAAGARYISSSSRTIPLRPTNYVPARGTLPNLSPTILYPAAGI